MITKEMEEAFDTDNENFAKMMEIIGRRIYTKKEDGDELHHIIPVTWYAQTSSDRPEWMPISVFGKAIRACEDHPANDESNLVYLSREEHQLVHRYISLCANEDWNAPAKGVGVQVGLNEAGTYVIRRPSARFDGTKFEFTKDGTFIVRAGEKINFTPNDLKRSASLRESAGGKVDFVNKVFTDDVTFKSEYCLFYAIAWACKRDMLDVVNVDTGKSWAVSIIKKGDNNG